ncbi:MAG: hypothetical protein IJE10_09725 [Clostridia bacterium]|nr:hypothetical protein [Clostridia bacterium]
MFFYAVLGGRTVFFDIEKTNKEKALALSKRVAEGYRDFNADEKHFLEVRRILLETAEKIQTGC